jgi:hypothetical protein
VALLLSQGFWRVWQHRFSPSLTCSVTAFWGSVGMTGYPQSFSASQKRSGTRASRSLAEPIPREVKRESPRHVVGVLVVVERHIASVIQLHFYDIARVAAYGHDVT